MLRTSDFPPKVYDSVDPQTSVLHYNLWRVFVDRPSQQQQQQQQQSDQKSYIGNEDDTKSCNHEYIRRLSNRTDYSWDTASYDEKCSETTSLSSHIPLSYSWEEKLQSKWEQSAFAKRERDYPGCTVTVADFNETRYRFERRTIYTDEAHGKFSRIPDCDPMQTTKDVFLDKLEESKAGLVDALREKPDWSKLRWVNVNGFEKNTLFSIIDEFKLDLEAISEMLTSLNDDCNVHVYDKGQLFCALGVLHCFENGSNIKQSNAPPDSEETIIEQLHRLFPNVTTYLREKSKMKLFDPNEEHARHFTAGKALRKKEEKKFEKSKLLKTLNHSLAIERGWIFITESNTVVSFFENSGEEVEERVFFGFLKSLKLHGEMKTDEFVCFEEILRAFSLNLGTSITLSRNLLYNDFIFRKKKTFAKRVQRLFQRLLHKFKVFFKINASRKSLQELYLMTDELSVLKLQMDRWAKMVNVIMGLPKISYDCKRYMLVLNGNLEKMASDVRDRLYLVNYLIECRI
ncbi:unnamed protein product [Ambrosiozyma monospora]|uniref:Unnamed protein product n=1 Tax=Ambrosiozyma monospora TaxID=43982 RepID=A0A9W7DDA8_AMBMO|nr:unnamed protein product [Ambrosiozyma monospora]